jgi:hypothetical protein
VSALITIYLFIEAKWKPNQKGIILCIVTMIMLLAAWPLAYQPSAPENSHAQQGTSLSTQTSVQPQPSATIPLQTRTTTTTVVLTPSSQPAHISYPHLVSVYQGQMHNTSVGGTATFALISIVQNQKVISGEVISGPGLDGSGSFIGTIETDVKS